MIDMDKLNGLEKELKKYNKVAIAYSGGVDSNFLLEFSKKVLGKDNVLAILCQGEMMANDDLNFAIEQLKDTNHYIIPVHPLEISEFLYNDKTRCYHCKKYIMSKVKEKADELGYLYVLDGKNKDDEKVYRPGAKACDELGIISPLALTNLTKQDIRDYSKKLNIITYNKPANACLATRFDYGTKLSLEKLEMVDKGEKYLHGLGIKETRLRVHGDIARIEVNSNDFEKVLNNQDLIDYLISLGFRFITLDLQGLKSGGYDENKRDITKA